VRNLRKSVYLLMAIMALSAPLLSCTLPGWAMSEEEKECCRHMADQCGSAQMEESHSCCTKTHTVAAGTLQPATKYSPVLPDCAGQAAPDPVPAFAPCVAISAIASSERCESPPGHISVLRI
jgi:hypothetical protein